MSSKFILKLVLKIIPGIALALALLLPAVSASGEGAALPHEGPWPIRNGHNYQPTEHELRLLHLEDVTPDQAREIDRLYKELLANSEGGRKRHPVSEH
jgi:hypothetical protein